jgi:hypothetical protein
LQHERARAPALDELLQPGLEAGRFNLSEIEARVGQQDDAAAEEGMERRAEQQAGDRIDDVIEQAKAKTRRCDAV